VNNWSVDQWRAVLESSPEGIVVCSATAADRPILYVNAAFTQLTGHQPEALLGRNLRFLQGAEREQEGRQRLRMALERGESCRVLLRNFRADGQQFWNEVIVQPIRDDGQLTHWISYHRDVGERLKPAERVVTGLPVWMREDRFTGLHSRSYLEEVVQREFALAQRAEREIGLVFFDIDGLGTYNETFDRAAGDACIKRIARLLGTSYRRGSDVVARWEGGTFAILTQDDPIDKATEYAAMISQRARDLLIHHPRALDRYVTLSGSVSSFVPAREANAQIFIDTTLAALKRAKRTAKGAVVTANDKEQGGKSR
jgi:diguanylate cyclase (GGDEF)-like protein/PAS domain S-box-containing protein